MDQASRLGGALATTTIEGWTLERLTRPSRLFGANGIRGGADGRIYVAQVPGSRISAIDPDSGVIEDISPIDGPVTAPDDLVFDDQGNLYITEITIGRVSMLGADGTYRVINDDMPVANPITMHDGRLIAGECRVGGRVMELDKQTGKERIILGDAPMPNAFSVGPDGKLYMPMMAANQIWRIDLAGGEPEIVASDLGVPDSVKFDSKGRIISTQVVSGEVLRIDPVTGSREVLANIAPGLDNCTFIGERLFVSSISGQVTELLNDGRSRPLVEDGLQWPMGLAMGPTGDLFVADGAYSYLVEAGGNRHLLGFLIEPGNPGFIRGVASDGPGQWLVTTSNGQVVRWMPSEKANEVVAEGFQVLFGIARASDGAAIFADGETGKVMRVLHGTVEELANGLLRPMGVATSGDGDVFVAESRAGRIVRIAGGETETLIDGLQEPQAIVCSGDKLFILDAEAREIVRVGLDGSGRQTLASGLPVKSLPGTVPKILGGVGDQAGPMEAFAGLAIGPDGTIYIAGDAEGSVLALRQIA